MPESKSPSTEIKSFMEAQVQRIRAALGDRTIRRVAEATGLHENTVRNLKNNKGGLPALKTIEILDAYLFARKA